MGGILALHRSLGIAWLSGVLEIPGLLRHYLHWRMLARLLAYEGRMIYELSRSTSLFKSIMIRNLARASSLSHFLEGEKSRQGEQVLDDSIFLSIILNMNIASSHSSNVPRIYQSLTLASTYFHPMWQPCYTSFGAISLGGPREEGLRGAVDSIPVRLQP